MFVRLLLARSATRIAGEYPQLSADPDGDHLNIHVQTVFFNLCTEAAFVDWIQQAQAIPKIGAQLTQWAVIADALLCGYLQLLHHDAQQSNERRHLITTRAPPCKWIDGSVLHLCVSAGSIAHWQPNNQQISFDRPCCSCNGTKVAACSALTIRSWFASACTSRIRQRPTRSREDALVTWSSMALCSSRVAAIGPIGSTFVCWIGASNRPACANGRR